jgi:hypothetical protein
MLVLDTREIHPSASLANDGPPTSLAEVYRSTYDEMEFARNAFAGYRAQEQSYDDEIEKIYRITGQRLENPYRVKGLVSVEQARRGIPGNAWDFYELQLRELKEKHPELEAAIGERSRPEKMFAVSRAATLRSRDVWDRYQGPWLLGEAAAVAGGFASGLRDPVNQIAMMAGPWGTVSAGTRALLLNAAKVAGINAAAEAAAQPFIQDYRRRAGLDYGWRQALWDISAAGLFGCGLALVPRAAFRGVQRFRGLEPRIDDRTGGITGWQRPQPAPETGASGKAAPAPAATTEPPSAPAQAIAFAICSRGAASSRSRTSSSACCPGMWPAA